MDIATSLANTIIDHLLRNQAYTPATTIWLAAFNGDPFNGGSEVGTAVSGAPSTTNYNRAQLNPAVSSTGGLNAAASKATANTNQIQITMPPGMASSTPVNWLAIYDAQTGGNMLARIPFTGTTLEATVSTADLFSTGVVHGLTTDDRVAFSDVGTLPAGITAGTIYYVLAAGLTTVDFKVSTASAGTALDVTAAGGCLVRKIGSQLFNASNILQIAAGGLTFTMAAGG